MLADTDPVARRLTWLEELAAGTVDHINGNLLEHLRDTHDLLASWGNLGHALRRRPFAHGLRNRGSTDTAAFARSAGRVDCGDRIRGRGDRVLLRGLRSAVLVRPNHPRTATPVSRPVHGATFPATAELLSPFCELTFANELEIMGKNVAHVCSQSFAHLGIEVRVSRRLGRNIRSNDRARQNRLANEADLFRDARRGNVPASASAVRVCNFFVWSDRPHLDENALRRPTERRGNVSAGL